MTKTKEQLIAERNQIVSQFNKDMEPLREQRANGTLTSWIEWDRINDEMSEKVAYIDRDLFRNGWLD